MPRGLRDSEFRLIVDEIVLPLAERHAPDVLVIQCGADALADDPLSRMELSNWAIWEAVGKSILHAARVLVTGGGGYNPWSVARCWSGVWATLNRFEIPAQLESHAVEMLRALTWNRAQGKNPPELWFSTIADIPSQAAVRGSVRKLVADAHRIYVANEDK